MDLSCQIRYKHSGMTKPRSSTIAEKMRAKAASLTGAERKLSHALQADYPMRGLASMPEFARVAGVSTPSVLRFAKKLGFSGFPAFQSALRLELSAQLSNPIAKQQQWAAEAPKGHVLNRFAQAAMENLKNSLGLIDHRSFDDIVALLSSPKLRIHVLGGRITAALAQYLAIHLQMARGQVELVPFSQTLWPQHLLEIGKGSVIVVFDVRRYDVSMRDFAASAKRRGAKIVLITDQWMSPISSFAVHSLPVRIEVPTSWDSNIVSLFVVEALVAGVVERNWPKTQSRINALELERNQLYRSKP